MRLQVPRCEFTQLVEAEPEVVARASIYQQEPKIGCREDVNFASRILYNEAQLRGANWLGISKRHQSC